jgi:hypothetical protein
MRCLMEQLTLIVRRKRNRHHLMPLVEQRLRLAESLAGVIKAWNGARAT